MDNYVKLSPKDSITRVSFKGYSDPVRVQEDIMLLMNEYPDFTTSRQPFKFRDGRKQEFVQLRGPISIQQKDGAYDVELVIWLAIHHPHKAPMVEVRPAHHSQTIKDKGSQCVESDGRVNHPYLKNWKYEHSNVSDLIKALSETFILDPPIYNTQLTFYHVPVDGHAAIPRPDTQVHSILARTESEYVTSSELEQFAESMGLSEDMKWWLAENGFQTVKAISCMRESDLEKIQLPLADILQLREAISDLKGVPMQRQESKIAQNLGKTLMRMMQQMGIKPDQVEFEGPLGEGNFGVVSKAVMHLQDPEETRLVAMKTLQRHATQQHLESFLEEVINMRPLHHHNVMGMLGFVEIKSQPYIVMEFMSKGDLRTYISDPDRAFAVTDMLKYGIQIGQGMAYLAGQNFIHGDLAARNCFLSDDDIVKIGDFGLARHLFMSDYYRSSGSKPCPSRWMAPEVLHTSIYTLKSDVWSYGVVLWELLTRGKTPFVETAPVLVDGLIRRGYRLGRPKAADNAIYRVLKHCWNGDDEARPTFPELCEWLTKMVHSEAYSDVAVVVNDSHIEPIPPRAPKHVSKVSSLMSSNTRPNSRTSSSTE